MLFRPVSTMRATHSVMMSRLVIKHAGGIEVRQIRVSASGQPSVECGQSAELNQVSSTSSSWTNPSAS